MSWVRLPGMLSGSPLVLNLERRFGLIGYARLVKMLELLAGSVSRDEGKASLSMKEWLNALQASRDELIVFLNALTQAGWLTFVYDEPSGLLTVDFLQADSYLPEVTPVLLTSADMWAFWCETELNMPRSVTRDPYTQQLFRRWCASNVTVTEMLDACEKATKGESVSLSPQSLHVHLQAVRKSRLEQARV